MADSHDSFHRQMPFPIAQLYVRGHNAKSHLERYLAAYYLWEASLKLLAATAIAEYAEMDSHAPEIEERLHSLARPSTGHWWEYIKLLVPVLAAAGDESFSKINETLLGRARNDMPRATALDARLREELEGKASQRTTVKLSELFDRMVAFRNRELGHGATGQQTTGHYEKLGRTMLLAMEELLQRIDVLAGRHLLYVAEVKKRGSGDWDVERFSLAADTVWRLNPLRIANAGSARVPSPDQIYLEDAASNSEDGELSTMRSLHPLLIYDPDSGEVFFLNGRRGKKQANYLCYTSGNVVHRESLEKTQQELLSRVLRIPVAREDVNEWTQEVTSEEPELDDGPGADTANEKFLNEFQLISLIGRGGMGEVYRAWQPSLGREVALKCLMRTGDANAEARFAREIRALGKVEHPHLVKIFTAGTDDDQCYYAMELIEGADLESVTRQLVGRKPGEVDNQTWRGVLTTAFNESRNSEKQLSSDGGGSAVKSLKPPESTDTSTVDNLKAVLKDHDYVFAVVEYIRQAAEAAHALHQAGVVHRDIKPGNIMIDMRGKAVLMDLGLAKLAFDSEGQLTRTRQFVGTICYASPEQVLSSGHLDLRSDVYSLGATLWELLALRPPFAGSTESSTYKLMRQIQQDDPEPLSNINPRVSRDLSAIVQKCMEKSPEARYQTAEGLAKDLKRYQRNEDVTARHVGAVGRLVRRCRRRPAATAAWTTICGLTLVTIIGMFLIFGRTGERKIPDSQVAFETYPGTLKQWWFDNDQIAWNMLPMQRTKLAGAADSQYGALYDTEHVTDFINGVVDAGEDLPEFEMPAPPSQQYTMRKPRIDEDGELIPETEEEERSRLDDENRTKLREALKQISAVQKNLELVQGDTPEVMHTSGLLYHRLAVLNETAGRLQLKLPSESIQPYEKRASECRQKSQVAFTRALEAYAPEAPLRVLCEFDEIQFLKQSDEHAAADKLYRLNERLRKEADKFPWMSGYTFKMFRLSALYEGGTLCRVLAKRNQQQSGGTIVDYFARSEEQYFRAKSMVEELLETVHEQPESHSMKEVQQELDEARVELLDRLGLVYMDQWKFGEAKKQFDAALRQQEKTNSVAGRLQESGVPLIETTADTFDARMNYIRTTHFHSMALCYTNYLSLAAKEFSGIIDEMAIYLEQATDRSEEELVIVRNQHANSLERYSECLQTLSGKRDALEKTAWDASSRVVYKRLITLALSENTLAQAAQELKHLEEISDPLEEQPTETDLLRRIARTIPMIQEGNQEQATRVLLSELGLEDGLALTNRESIVTRLLAWQLLMKYSADKTEPNEIFERIKGIVSDKMLEQQEPFSDNCLDLYKEIIETPSA